MLLLFMRRGLGEPTSEASGRDTLDVVASDSLAASSVNDATRSERDHHEAVVGRVHAALSTQCC
jgi:hypothetical protein